MMLNLIFYIYIGKQEYKAMGLVLGVNCNWKLQFALIWITVTKLDYELL